MRINCKFLLLYRDSKIAYTQGLSGDSSRCESALLSTSPDNYPHRYYNIKIPLNIPQFNIFFNILQSPFSFSTRSGTIWTCSTSTHRYIAPHSISQIKCFWCLCPTTRELNFYTNANTWSPTGCCRRKSRHCQSSESLNAF